MAQLYHHLGAGLAPADALRAVRLQLRDTPGWDSPHLWAAFILYGDPPAITAPTPALAPLGAALVALAALLARHRASTR